MTEGAANREVPAVLNPLAKIILIAKQEKQKAIPRLVLLGVNLETNSAMTLRETEY
jgi:hypothetical protein